MKNKVVSYLRKDSWLYKFLRFFYWRIVFIKAFFVGTGVEEKKWANRGIKEVTNSFSNLNHPHRDFLLKEISVLFPFSDILEVGCGYGPNLYLLSKKFPQVKFTGIDINPLSVQEGNKWLGKEGRSNIKLIHAKADGLG